MRPIRFFSTQNTKAYIGKSLRNLAVICVGISLAGITLFRETTELNTIAALIILAVACWLPGVVITDASSHTEAN